MIHHSEKFAEMIRHQYASSKAGPLMSWDLVLMEQEEQLANELLNLEKLKERFQWDQGLDFSSFLREKYTLVVTDLQQQIIWASSGFYTMTGYTTEEVLGQRPTFLQGEDTDQAVKRSIADKVRKFETAEARLINYRKDGQPYLCYVKIQAIRNRGGDYSHFFAIEKNIRPGKQKDKSDQNFRNEVPDT